MEFQAQVELLAESLKQCQKIVEALGDGVRQHLIIEMIRMNQYEGIRVGELAERSNLSRSAVSHHLQILKEAGIVSMRREGTKNYYYFDSYDSCEQLIQVLRQVQNIERMVQKPTEEV